MLLGLPTTARDDTAILQQTLMRQSRCSSYGGDDENDEGAAATAGTGAEAGGDGSLREWLEEEGEGEGEEEEKKGNDDPLALASDPSLTFPHTSSSSSASAFSAASSPVIKLDSNGRGCRLIARLFCVHYTGPSIHTPFRST